MPNLAGIHVGAARILAAGGGIGGANHDVGMSVAIDVTGRGDMLPEIVAPGCAMQRQKHPAVAAGIYVGGVDVRSTRDDVG